jgi:enoyl-CoA hydratase
MTYETILVDKKGRVGLIMLNRPQALNALNSTVMREAVQAAAALQEDDGIGAIVLTGSEKAFAAGADIKEMSQLDFVGAYKADFFGEWERFAATRKPIIAAVAGYALGGGCELAMMCDFIIAAENAKFGQPEITLGVIPGMGGTQRLTRAVGKAKAMDLCLTGRMMDAAEAEASGLVARVVPLDKLMETAMEAAEKIAGFSLPSVMMAKEAVNRAYEQTLAEGLRFERRMFHSTLGTEDQKEGMNAFIEKRKPDFKHR